MKMEKETENIPDRELIRNCQNGNTIAFEKLVRRYYGRAYGIAIMKIRDPDLAFDISQEAFIQVFRNIKRFDLEKSFSPWLYKIVQNLCLNYLRRRKRRWIVFSDLFRSISPIESQPGFVEINQFEKNEQQAHLWKALKRLEKFDREIITLRDIQDFSYKEISEILSIPIGTVMSRLYYARKKMLKLLEEGE